MRDLLNRFMQDAGRFARDEEGATAIEYALIASLLAIMSIGALRALSGNMIDMYDEIEDAVTTANNGGGGGS